MMTSRTPDAGSDGPSMTADAGEERKKLAPAAQRALKEAAARRAAAEAGEAATAREIGGRGGRDPARYGDWEIKGKAVDF